MPFEFHPPTRTFCKICESSDREIEPVIDSHRGKASSADNFAIHNWFNFVLGYSPEFPEYMIKRFKLDSSSFIVDPFSGSGTTSVYAKSIGIPSAGVEANDYFHFASKTKLEWRINHGEVLRVLENVLVKYKSSISRYEWEFDNNVTQSGPKTNFATLASKHRPAMLDVRYVSDHTFAQFHILKRVLNRIDWKSPALENLFKFAMSSILVPCSNVRYGPGFGVSKKVKIVNVLEVYEKKIRRMAQDLALPSTKKNRLVSSKLVLGDSRQASTYFKTHSADAMITSPPYPGDHEYTKHSRLELIFGDYAKSLSEFRVIKQRMLRGSTTNIYRDDNLGSHVSGLQSIQEITEEIDKRLKHDGATSGFEKLYSKLVREYFGGMYLVFVEALKVLKPGAPFALLVSDSHAFKMVHISTATILGEVALLAGFTEVRIDLWQWKKTTSHSYELRENILIVQ
jgi:DNA modification methylase